MRLTPYVLAALLVLTVALPPTWLGAGPTSADYVRGELLVYLHNPGDLPAIARDYNLDPTPLDQFGSRPIYRLRLLGKSNPEERSAALVADGRVRLAEPNYLGETPESRRRTSWAGGDPGGYAAQWAPAAIGLPAAHGSTLGAGVTVAVLDTGVDPDHPALAGRLAQGFDFVDLDADPREVGRRNNLAYGHGTHVAGLVALAAPGARIMPVRVLDPAGVGNIWVLAEGLAYAVDPDGDPATLDGAGVINLSLGTLRRTALLDQIVAEVTCARGDDDDDDDDDEGSLCRGEGAVVTAAAGNDGVATPLYPAAEGVPGLLAVAASRQANTLASFSNYGPWVDLAAPGEAIMSSVPGGGYGVWSGTSMAAPLVAGVAALLRAADPGLEADEVAEELVDTAAPLCGTELGRLDAAAALDVGENPARCTVLMPSVVVP